MESSIVNSIQAENPNKLVENWRNPDGTFKPGHPDLGAGRPKGQTLKEYWRERFKNMTEEEKLEFTKKVGNESIWKMAEGMPPQEIKGDIEVLSKVIKLDE